MKNSNSGPASSCRSILFNAATCILILLLGCTSPARATDNRAPDVPTTLQVPDGNQVSFHVLAIGVQIYRATPSTNSPTGFAWTLAGPDAVLLDLDGNVVGTHYAFAGPTRPAWETQSGSRVVGIRTVAPVTVDPTAIPWLILSADPANTVGPGVLARTTFIQRVNTAGGLAPAAPPTQLSDEVKVAYTAEYYFFRAHK